MNFAAVAESPSRAYGRMFPVHLSSGDISRASVTGIGRVSFSRAPSIGSSTASKARACVFLQRSSTEGVTRIGELHVANSSGMTGHYDSSNAADAVVSVGASLTGGSGTFSGDGSISISNSIGSGGGFKNQGAYSWYVNGHLYYGRFQGEGTECVAPWLLESTSSVGDAFPGTRSAPVNPYGKCGSDPNGHATVAANGGYWGYDYSRAHTYDGSFSWFGFGFSTSNGFTSDVQERWDNNGSPTTLVCGDVNPVQDSRIFWNDLH